MCSASMDCPALNQIVGDYYQCASATDCPQITYMLSLKTFECVADYPANSTINAFDGKICYKTCPLLLKYTECIGFCTATQTTNCAVSNLQSCPGSYYKDSCADCAALDLWEDDYLCYFKLGRTCRITQVIKDASCIAKTGQVTYKDPQLNSQVTTCALGVLYKGQCLVPFQCPEGYVWIGTGCYTTAQCTEYESLIDEAKRCIFKPQPEGLWNGS